MTKDQKTVAVGAASGILSMITGVTFIYSLWPANPALTELSSRLAYTLQAAAFAVLPLVFGIIAVGNGRFLSEAIDPTLHKESAAMEVNGRVLDNTLQQFLIYLVGTLALSTVLTADQMRVIPATAIVFVVARIAFWIGYRIHPLYRAFGFAATIYLNVGILGFAFWTMLR
jgi:hypothetical protein